MSILLYIFNNYIIGGYITFNIILECNINGKAFIFYSILLLYIILQDRFDTLEDGISAVKANKVWGLMHFPRNYSSSLWTRFKLIADTSDEDIDLSTISIWMDSTGRLGYIIMNSTAFNRNIYLVVVFFTLSEIFTSIMDIFNSHLNYYHYLCLYKIFTSNLNVHVEIS